MQQKTYKQILLQLKLLALAILLMMPAAFLFSFKASPVYSDIWQQLGISREKGSENIRSSFMYGYLHYYGVKNIKNLIIGDRVSIARDLMNITKEQMNSEAFRKFYEQERRQAKPQEPDVTVRTKEEIRKEKIAETEKSIRETEANLKQMKPDMAKALQPVLEMLKNNLKEFQTPESQMIELFYQGELMNNESRIKSYKEQMKNWETNYPEDHRQFIKLRLQKFLSIARTVDFNAALKEVNGKKKFVNPQYEGKPYEWKQVFRTGKEVIEPAMVFAEQWIKELN